MSWRDSVYGLIGAEISRLTRYADEVAFLRPVGPEGDENPSGLTVADYVECPAKALVPTIAALPDWSQKLDHRGVVLINGNLNYSFDIQQQLLSIRTRLSRHSRVIAVVYNSYLDWLYRVASTLRIRKAKPPTTFFTTEAVANLARISGFEVVRERACVFFPWRLFGLGSFFSRVLAAIPVLRQFSLAEVIVFRPILPSRTKPSLSILIPARNERGNIEAAIKRLPDLGCKLEVIFVEGHSSDGTWEEIQRVIAKYGSQISIKAFQQTGKGKADAVRTGFAQATCDLLTILDADLTMPPELLGRFYGAYTGGLADFVNGSRLVYPMEGEAMRFLNRLGNVFFAKALSSVLEQRLGDSLCGTKLVTRRDYERFRAWRKDFGEFDPFGDFELLFPAATLALGIVDVPVRYRARTYGSTNIRRFRDGWILLKMTTIGLLRIRIGDDLRKARKK